VIDYVPDTWLIESKSLKFYLASFRNQIGFHEECTIEIGKRVAAALEPAYLRIGGYWYPRGGMPLMFSGQQESCQPRSGYPTKGSPLIGGAGNISCASRLSRARCIVQSTSCRPS